MLVALQFTMPSPLSSRQRKIFRGASLVASIDRTSEKGNVTKQTLPSPVYYMLPGK